MKALPTQDRPRERLARAGAGSLGDHELVALLLGAGVRARGALIVAQEILERTGGVQGLARVGLDELQSVTGVGGTRAARLLASAELGRRITMRAAGDRPRFSSAAELGEYLLPLFGGHREERFGVVMLDAKLRLIRIETLSVGTVDTSIAHPREVFRAATLASASAIALFHNHPSGDPEPSPDDVMLTHRLAAAGTIMGIEVIEHLVLGDGNWFSFRDAGIL